MGGVGCNNKDGSTLSMKLVNGVLTDNKGRTGYIASNRQFQFDAPPQAGALLTAGWSVCDDGFLALGQQKIFYQCLSGSFWNLYDQNIAAQCKPVNFILLENKDC
ncbi:hypothetical protein BT63DRAFT_375174 [Microthyrium microscopicum]|uniref:Cell wall mannoprotein PIR1-like C-terminal domain-containing protein n=1 Tax=Microthyrium microscopicum TaxID=703497 RepID=A0A6A6U770_9PEZI|nr:hypothetical protein BT63DRAFT_375174 [Microthyrium microscopicum]